MPAQEILERVKTTIVDEFLHDDAPRLVNLKPVHRDVLKPKQKQI